MRSLAPHGNQGMGILPESLLFRIARGDQTAMGECLDRHGPLIWSIAMRLLGNRTEAEDAVQEAFIEIWKSAARYNPDAGSEIAFLTVIARRRILDRRRSLGRNAVQVPLGAELSAPKTVDHLAVCDEAAKAREALMVFSPEQRRVMDLAVCQGLSHQQVAESTGLPLGTVKTHIRRGLMLVRERMESPDKKEGGR